MYRLLQFDTSGANTYQIVASTDIHKPIPSGVNSTTRVLTRVEGFDEQENVQIITEPKLNGIGSYFVNSHIAEKEVSFDFNVSSGFYSTYRTLRNISLNPVGNRCKITYSTVNDTGTIQVSESLSGGFIKSVRSTDLTNGNKDWGTISLTCLFPDPTITREQ